MKLYIYYEVELSLDDFVHNMKVCEKPADFTKNSTVTKVIQAYISITVFNNTEQ